MWSQQRCPGPKPARGQLRLKGVLHILRNQASELGPNLLSRSCSQNLGLERLGSGAGLVGVPWKEGRVWFGGGGGRKPNPPLGLSRGSYLRAACILALPPALASAALLGTVGNHRVSLGASSFLEPSRGTFPPHPRQLSCAQGSGLFCCWERREAAGWRGEAPGHRVPGDLLTLLYGRPSHVCFLVGVRRHDPRTIILSHLTLHTPLGLGKKVEPDSSSATCGPMDWEAHKGDRAVPT